MIDHPVIATIQAHIVKNWEAYAAAISAICIAGVCMMPEKIPATFQEWWTWFRDTLQTAVPAARAQRANGNHQQAQPPANPTKEP